MARSIKRKEGSEVTLLDQIIFLIVIINAVVIFIQSSGVDNPFINLIDALCILFFLAEMVIKIVKAKGLNGYLKDSWNIFDGILVLISIPALIAYMVPSFMVGATSAVLTLRVLRVFRFTRLLELFGNLENIMKSFFKAVKDSSPIFFGFILMIVVFAMFSCSMFSDISPEYFGTPMDAMYSTFRICTTEGWYDIPDSITSVYPQWGGWVRAYFVLIVTLGGIIGLSLVNSIFVDAMVSDNNDELNNKIDELTKTITELNEKIEKLQK